MAVKDTRPKGQWRAGQVIEEGIQYRGPHQFRVQIRDRGLNHTKTLDTLAKARQWKLDTEKKILGGHAVEVTLPARTTLAEAAEWGITKHLGRPSELPGRTVTPFNWKRPNDKNLDSKWRWWRDRSPFKSWMLADIRDNDLTVWARTVLMEDVGDDLEDLDEAQAEVEEMEGNAKPVTAQTIIHRLNALSTLIKEWRLANSLSVQILPNPVSEGVRPPNSKGRHRRLNKGEDVAIAMAAAASSRPWLSAAVTLAIATGMRQSELAKLTWDRVHLDDEHPYAFLPETKNGRAREVPFSEIAIEALADLRALADGRNRERDARIENAKTDSQRTAALVSPTWTKPLPVVTGRGVIHAFRDAVEAYRADGGVGLDDLRWHDLRHEAVSRLYELTNMTETAIMGIVGHLSKEMTVHYATLRGRRWGAELPTADSARGDPAGTVKLRPGKPAMVKTMEGKWVRLAVADGLLAGYSRQALEAAMQEMDSSIGESIRCT
jgi:integrase